MLSRFRTTVFICFFAMFLSCPVFAETDSGWRIAPENLNIQLGEDRALQVLDDSAQELKGATWSVDNLELAELREDGGYMVLHPKALGTVVVTAVLGEETRTREIKIWSPLRPLPAGTIGWSGHPIGREINDLPAVPGDGPNLYSLEQTESGKTYLRANREDGIQLWAWLMPETVHDVELVCGDWMGGALISANRKGSFTLYTVGKDGQTRWKYTFSGIRKGHAYNLQHLVHILSQSADGTVTTITGIDEESGALRFELKLPVSGEIQKNVRRNGASVICSAGTVKSPLPTIASRLFVNMDGNAYVAFTQSEWTLGGGKCTVGTAIDPATLNLVRDDRLLLWQIHPDGTYQNIVVESEKLTQALSAPVNIASPTGALLTDNMNGTLISVRLADGMATASASNSTDEFIYRVNEQGELVYKLAMPKYSGTLHDDAVIGNDGLGFAARGGTLIAFNVREGKDLWQWDSRTDEISVVAALAGGSCLVQTPTDAVKVDSSTKARVVIHGKIMVGWNGQVYRKHN